MKTYSLSTCQANDEALETDDQNETTEQTDLLSLIPEDVINLIEEKGDTDILKTLDIISKEIDERKSKASETNVELNEHIQTETYEHVNDEENETIIFESSDWESIVRHLHAKSKTVNVTSETIKDAVSNAGNLNRTFVVSQLDIIAETIKGNKMPSFTYKKSWNKTEKVNALSRVLGDKSTLTTSNRKKTSANVPTLKRLAEKIVNSPKVKKSSLCPAFARYILPNRMAKWEEKYPIPSSIKTEDGTLVKIDWYSVPEKNPSTNELMCKCIDSHHLLTNLRTKTSTTGLENIYPRAWKKVAATYETKLTPSMVDDLVDKQSNANAQTHFSEEVEDKMKQNGDYAEAEFCSLIRGWYEAEDSTALSATERIDKWLKLRNYLLRNIDFAKFPPPARYIKGFSIVSYEGFLAGIDTKLQLYHLCGGSYCVRTASSLPAETCVGGIQDLNFNNSVAVKAKDVPNIMASISEIMTYKSNPERGFFFKTSRSAVYPVIQGQTDCNTLDSPYSDQCNDIIVPRNHTFDLSSRRRTKPHRKPGTVNMNLDAAPRGAQPLRRQFFTTNESKIDPLKKGGFPVVSD